MAQKRTIFEEVGAGAAKQSAAGGMISTQSKGARGAVRLWLMLIFALVAVMIAVGGLTRLTDSGLSITEWNPVMGALPPLTDADWQTQFTKYQASPQGQIVNAQMTSEAFKQIFWWEWGHRELGRVIGLVWAVGFGFFALTRRVPAGWAPRLWGLGLLIGIQGAIGWGMVASGLTGRMVKVASYWLALHLAGAFLIYGFIAWWVFLLGRSETDLLTARRNGERKLFGLSTGVMHFLFLQIVLGALVAGIDAGRNYPTWPDMNGSFFPSDAFDVPGLPLWANPGLVQFIHRISGYLLFAFGVVAWLRGRKSAYKATRTAFNMMMAMLVLQVALGIYTALSAAQLHMAITHQVGAVVLWVLVLRARHLSAYPVQGSIREGTA
jgi:cytochrome c oxidase assembly protein subunit 15